MGPPAACCNVLLCLAAPRPLSHNLRWIVVTAEPVSTKSEAGIPSTLPLVNIACCSAVLTIRRVCDGSFSEFAAGDRPRAPAAARFPN